MEGLHAAAHSDLLELSGLEFLVDALDELLVGDHELVDADAALVARVVALGAGFNGGTIPVNRFAIPFNGGLTTAGAMTFSAAMNFGTPSSLSLGGDATIPAGVVLNFAMTGSNTLTGTGRLVAGSATSQVSLGGGFNNTYIPGANFTNFGGVVSMISPLSLSSTMILGAAGVLDLGQRPERHERAGRRFHPRLYGFYILFSFQAKCFR